VVSRDAQARCKITDNCVRCLHGIGHPPLVALFDPAAGKYVIAEGSACMARWASSGRRNAEGDLCAGPATERIGDVDLCLYHYHRALDWLGKRDAEIPLHWKEKRREAERIARETSSVVYYLLSESTGLIKIGFSSDYRARLSKLKGEHGALRLLLATIGGRKQEDEAHTEFAEHWDHGEWFRAGKSLLLYIQRARRAQGTGRTRLPEAVPIEEVRALIRAQRKASAA
jgi:hypothetical protein